MNSTQVSVALCTFNGAAYLHEQLHSIAAQSCPPLEVIVCDDGSQDGSVAIVESFAKTVPFTIRLFANAERLGPARNFEKAISLCQGEIIFLCDQDDRWKPSKIQSVMRAFEQHPEAMYVFSDAKMITEQGDSLPETLWNAVGLRKKLGTFSGAGQVKTLLKHNVVTGATMAFRSSLREMVFPIPSGWMHDYWIVMLASALSVGIPMQEPLLEYRRHANQVCGWRKQTFWQVCKQSFSVGTEDWHEKVKNFDELLTRIDSLSSLVQCPPDRLALLRDKQLHLRKRLKTRSSRGVSRIARVLAEASTGRYQRFSDSWYSVVRDL